MSSPNRRTAAVAPRWRPEWASRSRPFRPWLRLALAGSTVTNTGPSVLNGDLGVAPGTALVGFGLPAVVNGATHDNDAVAVQAQSDLTTAYHEGRRVRSFRVVVGKPSTPTPRGRYFIEEAVRLSRRAAGAPFALATSARSQVLQEFDGGPGQIALHGTANLPGRLGGAASHGCIRMSPRAITWLAGRIRSGTPVTISR